mmetsp:Transcript_9967/g.22888  ORF Transcript_9967/g.22888 Transcript_9967/m.22888 type:complete len:290 (+) Transcript_9967:32-901(+)
MKSSGGAGGISRGERTLQRVIRRPPEVRQGHELLVDRASSAIASSLAESAQLLKEVGPAPAPRGAGNGTQQTSAAVAVIGPTARTASAPPQRVPVPSQIEGSGRAAPPDISRSARDLFAVLSGSAPVAPSGVVPWVGLSAEARSLTPPPRVISVRDYQRGRPVVAPAPPLPFPGPDPRTPGQRRRAVAGDVAAAPSPSRSGSHLADGISSMLTGISTELGELVTTPAAPCSSFDSLLSLLVDDPQACFADPLTLRYFGSVASEDGSATAAGARQPGRPQSPAGAFTFVA